MLINSIYEGSTCVNIEKKTLDVTHQGEVVTFPGALFRFEQMNRNNHIKYRKPNAKKSTLSCMILLLYPPKQKFSESPIV